MHLQAKSRVSANRNLLLTAIKQEYQNHLRFTLPWDSLPVDDVLRTANCPDELANDDAHSTRDIWRACVNQLMMSKTRRPTITPGARGPHIQPQDLTSHTLFGTNRSSKLTTTQRTRLRFCHIAEREHHIASLENPASYDINISDVPQDTLRWSHCRLPNGQVVRSYDMQRHNVTRSASIIRYIQDVPHRQTKEPTPKAFFGFVHQFFSVDIMNQQCQYAFIHQYPVYPDGPLLIRAKPRGRGESLEMIPVGAIQQLAAIVKSRDREAFATQYSSIFL